MEETKIINLSFWTKQSLKTERIGQGIKKIFFDRNDELSPIYWYGSKYTKDKNKKIYNDTPVMFIKALTDISTINGFLQNTQYGFTNADRKKREFFFDISFGGTPDTFYVFSFDISHSYFTTNERIGKFLEIGKHICELINPVYGRVHDISDVVEKMTNTQTYDVYNKIPRIYWCNYIGEMYLHKIGDEKLASFEAYKNEQVGEGRFIQLTESPYYFNTKQFIKKQKELEKIIGKKLIGYKEVDLSKIYKGF